MRDPAHRGAIPMAAKGLSDERAAKFMWRFEAEQRLTFSE
jgi:hypothetical protein